MTRRRLFVLSSLVVGLMATVANTSGWQRAETPGPSALLLQIQLPIELKTADQLKTTIDQAVLRLSQIQSESASEQRPYLILKFIPSDQRSSTYEACNVLAIHLAKNDIQTKCQTVALLTGDVQDHVLLPALACTQIFVDPEVNIGPLSLAAQDPQGQQVLDQAILEDYRRLARSNRLLPVAIVEGLLDSAQAVYELTTDQGITYATQAERDRLYEAAGFTKESTLSEAGEPFQLTSSFLLGNNNINTAVLESTDAKLKAKLNIAPNQFFKDAGTIGETRPAVVDLIPLNSSGQLSTSQVNEKTNLIKQLVEDGHNWIGFSIDCSGGDYTAILHLSNTIAELTTNVHTVAFVKNRALESTALIALACDEIFLSKHASIGGDGNQPLAEDELIDIQQPLEKLARSKQRPWSIYAASVNPKLAVHLYRHRLTGEQQAFCANELKEQEPRGNWQKQKLIPSDDGFSHSELRELGLTNQPMESMAAVLNHFGLDTSTEAQSKRPWVAAIERFAMNTWFASIMLTIGLYGLMAEMGTPGLGVPGILSLLCFALFLWSKELNGTVDALEIVLIVVGILCVAIEIFVIPGFGVFGFSGLGLILTGLVLASQTFLIPQNTFQVNLMVRSILTIIGSSLGVVVLYLVATRVLGDTWFGKMLAPARSDHQQQANTDWSESLVHWEHLLGLNGVTVTPLSPAGKVKIEGSIYDVISDGKLIDLGSKVKVIEVAGNRVVVARDVS